MNLVTHIGRLRIAALIEGITCIALYLIAMPLKYILGIDEAVRIIEKCILLDPKKKYYKDQKNKFLGSAT